VISFSIIPIRMVLSEGEGDSLGDHLSLESALWLFNHHGVSVLSYG